MSLSPQQMAEYDRDGFILVENVVDPETLDRLRAVIAEFKDRSRSVSRSDAVFDVGPGHSPETPRLRRLKHPVDLHPEFDSLMRSEAILDIIAPLLGGTVRFDDSKLNFKPVGGTAKIEWHQDWAFYPHTNDDLLAVGVMIEDCTQENGPLMIIPGSHRGEILNHHRNGYFCGGIPEEAVEDRLNEAVTLTAPAGSITVHHARALHASTENRSVLERPLLLFQYTAVDAFPVFATRDIEQYDRQILRGAATRVPRVEPVPIRVPLPRPEGNDSIFDDQAGMQP